MVAQSTRPLATTRDLQEAEESAQETRRSLSGAFDRLVETNLELASAVRKQVTAIYFMIGVNTVAVIALVTAMVRR